MKQRRVDIVAGIQSVFHERERSVGSDLAGPPREGLINMTDGRAFGASWRINGNINWKVMESVGTPKGQTLN